MTVLANRPGSTVTLHFTANSGTIVIQGNNSVSNVATGSEVINGAFINKIWYGSPSANGAYWTVARGANTYLLLDGTGFLDFTEEGEAIQRDSTANISFTLTGSTIGFVMVELEKRPNTDPTYV